MFGQINLRRAERSYIDVILKDGTYHHFTPRVLNVLLETERVSKFKRSNGWVTVGVDPVRIVSHINNGGYRGPERRGTLH